LQAVRLALAGQAGKAGLAAPVAVLLHRAKEACRPLVAA